MGLNKTDEELVTEHLAGSADAFEALVERYRAYAYRICWRMLGDHHGAEDASQEAFVRAFAALSGFRSDALFKTWFTRIVANGCINRRRAMKRAPRLAGDVPEPAARPEAPAVELTELQQKIQAAIEDLPEKQRLALILRVQENLEFEAIAEALEISPAAARVNLSLARKSLRETLAPHLVEKA